MKSATSTTRRMFVLMRRYVRGEGLTMAFQPITDLDTGAVVGFESLARFAGDPPRPPAVWFDEAAAAGLRQELEMAAAREALPALADLPEDAYLTINASPDVAMSPEFIALVREAGARLVVEITEHAPIEDYAALNAALAELRARGLRIAIDDAGAGFANMSHMLQINADLIKLDVELTRHVDIDARRKAMVASLVDFARSVGATLIAEGIETEAELAALRRLGVGGGQGYHLGRPLPLHTAQPSNEAARGRSWRAAVHGLADALSFSWNRNVSHPRRRAWRRAALVLTWALILGPTTLAVAENANPGSPAYWVKRRVEDVRLLVAFDRESEVRLHMQFARRRLNELNRVLAKGDSNGAVAVMADYRDHLESVGGSLAEEGAISASVSGWVGDELADYVESLEREVSTACAAPRRAACRSIEREASRSKLALEKVHKVVPSKERGPAFPGDPPAEAKGKDGTHPRPGTPNPRASGKLKKP